MKAGGTKNFPDTEFDRITVERSRGATYSGNDFAVYGYGVYERSSVLAGQQKRCYIAGGYATIEDAQKDYPMAEPSGCGYQPPNLMHLPGEDDPDPTGEDRMIDEEMRQERYY